MFDRAKTSIVIGWGRTIVEAIVRLGDVVVFLCVPTRPANANGDYDSRSRACAKFVYARHLFEVRTTTPKLRMAFCDVCVHGPRFLRAAEKIAIVFLVPVL